MKWILLALLLAGCTSQDTLARCEAAKQTVIEEMDLITATGKSPSEKITDRWKLLMKGCE